MIRIENLSKNYGRVRALDGLNLDVAPGVVYGFLGPNGAGKTTTMRILAGLARPDQGRAWILGKDLTQPGEDIRPLIGVLPEEPAFYGWMTAREYLRDFAAPLYGLRGNAAAQRVVELLDLVGLSNAADRRLAGFSRGMRQRLGLAQALIHRPPVLLLDEPVSALDPAGRKEVLDLIETLRGSTTILLSTHILADVERVCDVVGIISRGRLILQERREALLSRYAAPLFEIEASEGLDRWLQGIGQLPAVKHISFANNTARILAADISDARRELLASLAEENVAVRRFELVRPSLEEVFLQLTEKAVS